MNYDVTVRDGSAIPYFIESTITKDEIMQVNRTRDISLRLREGGTVLIKRYCIVAIADS